MRTILTIWLLMLFAASPARADPSAACEIDKTNSRVEFISRMLFDLPITGKMLDFEGELTLNEKRPELSQATIIIKTGSVDSGSPDTDNFIRSKPMLDSAAFPTSTLVTSAFNPQSGENLTVNGQLTIKDASHPISIPFIYRHRPNDDGSAELVSAEGSFVFSRLKFGIGVDSWSSTFLFKDEIEISVKLELICPKP